MDKALTRMARFLGVGGLASIVFGIVVLLWPGISLAALTALFGAFAFVYGVFALGAGLNLVAHRSSEWVGPIVGGLGGVLIGGITFLHPAITVLALTYLIAAYAFVTGIAMIVGSIDLWGAMKGAVWHLLAGLISIVFGVIVAFQPGAGLLAILWMVGVYAVLGGVLQLIGAYRIHQFHYEVRQAFSAPQPSAS